MGKVTSIPISATHTTEQALAHAVNAELADVLVVGYDTNGEPVMYGSRMTTAEQLFLLEAAKHYMLAAKLG